MMDDLISRQAALKGFAKYSDAWCYINALPTADHNKAYAAGYEQGRFDERVESKMGKWINHRNDEGHNIADCDQCGEAMQWFDDDIKPNYCPNCGARMEE